MVGGSGQGGVAWAGPVLARMLTVASEAVTAVARTSVRGRRRGGRPGRGEGPSLGTVLLSRWVIGIERPGGWVAGALSAGCVPAGFVGL